MENSSNLLFETTFETDLCSLNIVYCTILTTGKTVKIYGNAPKSRPRRVPGG